MTGNVPWGVLGFNSPHCGNLIRSSLFMFYYIVLI
jgi:hypothetical protein